MTFAEAKNYARVKSLEEQVRCYVIASGCEYLPMNKEQADQFGIDLEQGFEMIKGYWENDCWKGTL